MYCFPDPTIRIQITSVYCTNTVCCAWVCVRLRYYNLSISIFMTHWEQSLSTGHIIKCRYRALDIFMNCIADMTFDYVNVSPTDWIYWVASILSLGCRISGVWGDCWSPWPSSHADSSSTLASSCWFSSWGPSIRSYPAVWPTTCTTPSIAVSNHHINIDYHIIMSINVSHFIHIKYSVVFSTLPVFLIRLGICKVFFCINHLVFTFDD